MTGIVASSPCHGFSFLLTRSTMPREGAAPDRPAGGSRGATRWSPASTDRWMPDSTGRSNGSVVAGQVFLLLAAADAAAGVVDDVVDGAARAAAERDRHHVVELHI